MGDQHHGDPGGFVDLLEQVEDLFGGRRIERAGGLITEEHVGTRGQCSGDTDPLFLPTRQLGRVALRPVGQPDQVEQFGDPGVSFRLADALHFERERHVLGGGARVEQVEVLEDHAHAVPDGA